MRAASYAISAQPYLIRRTTPITGSIFTPGMPYTHAQAKVGKHNFQLDDVAAALVLTVQKSLSGRPHPIASSAGPITPSHARGVCGHCCRLGRLGHRTWRTENGDPSEWEATARQAPSEDCRPGRRVRIGRSLLATGGPHTSLWTLLSSWPPWPSQVENGERGTQRMGSDRPSGAF